MKSGEHEFNFGDPKCSCGEILNYFTEETENYNNKHGCSCQKKEEPKYGKVIPPFVKIFSHMNLTGAKNIISIKEGMTS